MIPRFTATERAYSVGQQCHESLCVTLWRTVEVTVGSYPFIRGRTNVREREGEREDTESGAPTEAEGWSQLSKVHVHHVDDGLLLNQMPAKCLLTSAGFCFQSTRGPGRGSLKDGTGPLWVSSNFIVYLSVLRWDLAR